MKVRLKDICEIQAGGTPNRSNRLYWDNGTINWAKISDIKNKYLYETEEKITEEGLYNSSAKLFKKNSILYTIFATLGEVCILDIDTATNQAIANLEIKSNSIEKEYLYYYLLSKKKLINRIGRGVAQNNINLSILKEMEIDVPDIMTQKKIIDILNRNENIVKKLNVQIELFDTLIKARFVEMFYNKGFDKVKIKELVDTNIETVKHVLNEKDEIKYFDISSIDNKVNEITKYSVHKVKDAPSRAQQVVEYNDILVSTVRPNLKNIAILSLSEGNLVASSGYCILRSIKGKSTSEYLLYCVLDDKFTEKMVDIATGASYPAIHDCDILNYEVYNVPIELQFKFSNIVHHIDKLKFEVKKSLEKTQMIFDSLMQQYFG